MNTSINQSVLHNSNGCGSATCGCVSEQTPDVMNTAPRVNGVALLKAGESCDHDRLIERAYSELLRQEAVQKGVLISTPVDIAPNLSEADKQVIHDMLEEEIHISTPSNDECQRYYDSHRQTFTVGQSRTIRHILFAVTDGVDVTALAQRAEAALFELRKPDVRAEKFSELAAKLSNCPTGPSGGELGELSPQDCAPEFAKELFYNQESSEVLGIMPRLVHTRHGFHIVDVQAMNLGKQPDFDTVKTQIQLRLQAQSRVTALRQYMSFLVGKSRIEGLQLVGANSGLVQ